MFLTLFRQNPAFSSWKNWRVVTPSSLRSCAAQRSRPMTRVTPLWITAVWWLGT